MNPQATPVQVSVVPKGRPSKAPPSDEYIYVAIRMLLEEKRSKIPEEWTLMGYSAKQRTQQNYVAAIVRAMQDTPAWSTRFSSGGPAPATVPQNEQRAMNELEDRTREILASMQPTAWVQTSGNTVASPSYTRSQSDVGGTPSIQGTRRDYRSPPAQSTYHGASSLTEMMVAANASPYTEPQISNTLQEMHRHAKDQKIPKLHLRKATFIEGTYPNLGTGARSAPEYQVPKSMTGDLHCHNIAFPATTATSWMHMSPATRTYATPMTNGASWTQGQGVHSTEPIVTQMPRTCPYSGFTASDVHMQATTGDHLVNASTTSPRTPHHRQQSAHPPQSIPLRVYTNLPVPAPSVRYRDDDENNEEMNDIVAQLSAESGVFPFEGGVPVGTTQTSTTPQSRTHRGNSIQGRAPDLHHVRKGSSGLSINQLRSHQMSRGGSRSRTNSHVRNARHSHHRNVSSPSSQSHDFDAPAAREMFPAGTNEHGTNQRLSSPLFHTPAQSQSSYASFGSSSSQVQSALRSPSGASSNLGGSFGSYGHPVRSNRPNTSSSVSSNQPDVSSTTGSSSNSTMRAQLDPEVSPSRVSNAIPISQNHGLSAYDNGLSTQFNPRLETTDDSTTFDNDATSYVGNAELMDSDEMLSQYHDAVEGHGIPPDPLDDMDGWLEWFSRSQQSHTS